MKKLMIPIFSFFLLIILFIFPKGINAQGFVYREEKINNYDSVIEIQKDRSLIIKETIKVTALSIDIKRGIFRDFPTIYKDAKNRKYIVGFEVLSVKKDGKTEPYSIEAVTNGKRIYIGSKNVYLAPNDYTYEITYRTTKQLGIFTDHDELYFNAIGTGWTFPITKGSVSVILPEKLKDEDIQMTSYTGLQYSTENNAVSRIDNSSITNTKVIFETTSALPPSNGLTIVVGWPKGHINYPTSEELILEEFINNLYIYIGIIGTLIISLYYLISWLVAGRDPLKGVVIPEYSIPDKISPGIVSSVNNMGFSNTALVANIVNLARKKVVTINEHDDSYNLKLTGSKATETITEEEQIIISRIDKYANKQMNISSGYSSTIHSFVNSYKTQMENLSKKFIKTNSKLKVLGVIFSAVLIFIISFLYSEFRDPELVTPVCIGLEFLLFFFGVLPSVIVNKSKTNGKATMSITKIIGGCAYLCLLFIVVSFMFTILISADFESTPMLLILPLTIVNMIALFVLPARTKEGRVLQDKIEGLKMYIKTAETERLKFMYKTFDDAVQNYEKILPYAIALGLELVWTNKFTQVFSQFKDESGNMYVHPSWYFMGSGVFNVSSFSSSLSSNIS
ncbi:MAG: DUF2207 domain-containing protein, partial [bacterium]